MKCTSFITWPEGNKLAKRLKGHVITGLLQNKMNGMLKFLRHQINTNETVITIDISERVSLGKNGQNVTVCSTESDLWVLKRHRVVLSSTLTTSRHCNQRKSMIHNMDWALKVHLAWEEERNAAQKERFRKTIASQGKFDKHLAIYL